MVLEPLASTSSKGAFLPGVAQENTHSKESVGANVPKATSLAKELKEEAKTNLSSDNGKAESKNVVQKNTGDRTRHVSIFERALERAYTLERTEDPAMGVDLSPIAGSPRATIAKMLAIKELLMSGANPSPQAQAAAEEASRLAAEAEKEIEQGVWANGAVYTQSGGQSAASALWVGGLVNVVA